MDTKSSSLDGKIQRLDAELVKYKEQMARLPEGPAKASIRQQAMRTLQQKKMYENQRGQLQQRSFNLEQTSFATDNLRDAQVMVGAMQTSVKEMKSFQRKINIDKVENIRDELEDLMEDANEINEVMSRSYGVPDYLDEADLDAELDALGEFEGVGEAAYLDALPAAPTGVSAPRAADAQPMQN